MIDTQTSCQVRDLIGRPAGISLVLTLHNPYLLPAKARPLDITEEKAVVSAVLTGCAVIRGGVIVRALLSICDILGLGPTFVTYTL